MGEERTEEFGRAILAADEQTKSLPLMEQIIVQNQRKDIVSMRAKPWQSGAS